MLGQTVPGTSSSDNVIVDFEMAIAILVTLKISDRLTDCSTEWLVVM